jgi:hypothetical protein
MFASTVNFGAEGGIAGLHDLARFFLPKQWSEFCYACDRFCTFAACAVCAEGFIVECLGCGDERIAPFTRANSEAS